MTQTEMFQDGEIIAWKNEWKNMPEYSNQDLSPKIQIIINFAFASDAEEFSKLIGQEIKTGAGKYTKSLWYPEQEIGRMANKRFIEAKQ